MQRTVALGIVFAAALVLCCDSPKLFAEPAASPADPGHKSFRVTITIFDGSKIPDAKIAEHLILFDNGMVYAVPQDPEGQITFVDAGRNRIVLLDPKSKKRTEINTNDLIELTANLRTSAKLPAHAQRLGIDAKVQVDTETNEYSVRYGNVSYTTTTTKPTDPNAATQFGQFAAWASRLNIARAVGLPPIGRMRMNDRIKVDGRMPESTVLQIRSGLTMQKYRSEHELIETISQADRKKIEQIGSMLALYSPVSLKDFPRD